MLPKLTEEQRRDFLDAWKAAHTGPQVDTHGGFTVPAECVPALERSFATGEPLRGPTFWLPIPSDCQSVTWDGVVIWERPAPMIGEGI